MSNKPVRLNSGKRTRRKSAFIYDVATIFLTILIAAALFPVSALASEDGVEAQSGWQALEAYALEKTDNPDIVDDIEAGKAAYGRELTAEEVEIWKKGFDARAAAEAAMDENRALTAAEEETIKQAAIAAFGSPEDRKVKSEQAMREKYPAPPPTQIIDLPKVTEKASKNVKSTVQEVKPSTFATQMTPLDMQQIMPETKEVPVEAQVLSAGADAQYTTAWVHQRTPGVGVYPTQKGKVLVTADLFTNGVTFGHAGIVTMEDGYQGGVLLRLLAISSTPAVEL